MVLGEVETDRRSAESSKKIEIFDIVICNQSTDIWAYTITHVQINIQFFSYITGISREGGN